MGNDEKASIDRRGDEKVSAMKNCGGEESRGNEKIAGTKRSF
jgi:hypothetical protein